MYIQPTASGTVQDNCLLLCIIPMLITATVECRIFAYFLLIRERYTIMNRLINFYRQNLNETTEYSCHHIPNNEIVKKCEKMKIFYITEFVKPREKTNLVPIKSSMKVKLTKSLRDLMKFTKSLFNFRFNDHSIADLDATAINLNINYVDRLMNIQTIYFKLHEIFTLVSQAYGLQVTKF